MLSIVLPSSGVYCWLLACCAEMQECKIVWSQFTSMSFVESCTRLMKHCLRVAELLRSEASNEYREEDGVGVLFDEEQL